MKTFKFHTVTPLFTEDLDFVVDNVRRVRRETGLNCIAFSLSMHPQGTPAAARAAKTIDAFQKVKQALAAMAHGTTCLSPRRAMDGTASTSGSKSPCRGSSSCFDVRRDPQARACLRGG